MVVLAPVLPNGADQRRRTARDPPPEALRGQVGEPALHQVQPRGARGREVEVVPGVSREPRLHLREGVGAVVARIK